MVDGELVMNDVTKMPEYKILNKKFQESLKKLKKDEYKKGGWVQEVVDSPDFRTGAFTKKAEKRGLTPEQFMRKVLSNPSYYDERTRRQAQFMENIGD
jgi:hypothetical protein